MNWSEIDEMTTIGIHQNQPAQVLFFDSLVQESVESLRGTCQDDDQLFVFVKAHAIEVIGTITP